MPPLPPDESRSEEARPCRACQPPRLAFRLCRARRPGFYHTARVMGGRPPVQAASSAGRCALCSSCPAFLSVLPVRLQVLPGSPRLRLGPSGPRRPRPRCSNGAACHAPPGSHARRRLCGGAVRRALVAAHAVCPALPCRAACRRSLLFRCVPPPPPARAPRPLPRPPGRLCARPALPVVALSGPAARHRSRILRTEPGLTAAASLSGRVRPLVARPPARSGRPDARPPA